LNDYKENTSWIYRVLLVFVHLYFHFIMPEKASSKADVTLAMGLP